MIIFDRPSKRNTVAIFGGGNEKLTLAGTEQVPVTERETQVAYRNQLDLYKNDGDSRQRRLIIMK